MKTTADFLDALRVHFVLPSDNKLALHMGWERQQLSQYRQLKVTFNDQTALKVAAALGIEPDHIMACMAAQRARTPEVRSAWERIAAKVAACILAGIALGAPSPAPAGFNISLFSGQSGLNTHMRQRRRMGRRLARIIQALVSALALSLGLTLPAGAADWTGYDTAREVAYQGALAVDCAQTRYGASHPDRFAETNPLLPEHPSKGRINNTCAAVGIGHYFISRWLPAGGARKAWQGLTIMVEVWAIDTNRMAGVKIEF